MRLSARPSAELVAWAAERIPCMRDGGPPQNATAMAVEDDSGRILGAIVFHNWEPVFGTIECSAAADDARWLLARSAIDRMWEYAFVSCGVQKVWSRTPRKNERALRFVKAIGLKYEAVLPRQFGDDDAVISGAYKEQFYGRQKPRTVAA